MTIKEIGIVLGFIAAIITLPPTLAVEPLSGLANSLDNIEQVNQLKFLEISDPSQIAWSPDGKLLAVADRSIYLYETQTFELNRLIDAGSYVNSIAFSPDGATLASTFHESVKLWDVSSGGEKKTLGGLSSVDGVAFSPDGTKIAVAVGQTAQILDVSSGHVIHIMIAGSQVKTVVFSPDGQTLASGSNSGEVKLWDVSSEKELHTLKHDIYLNCVVFSPDGQTLASGALGDTIKLWDVGSGLLLRTLEGHTDRIASVAFSPDGQTLASASWDLTIKLWDVGSGSTLRTLKGHTDNIESVAFSPDGKILASGAWDDTVRLWGITLPSPSPTIPPTIPPTTPPPTTPPPTTPPPTTPPPTTPPPTIPPTIWTEIGVYISAIGVIIAAITLTLNRRRRNPPSSEKTVKNKKTNSDEELEEADPEEVKNIAKGYAKNEFSLVSNDYKLLSKIERQEIRVIEKEKIKVESKNIGRVELEWVKFALVQLDYSIEKHLHPTFSYILREDKREEIKKKIFSALNLAAKEKVNIICFPELSFLKEWVKEIIKEYKEMVIICGSYYEDEFHICPIIIDGEYFEYKKVYPSPLESPGRTEHGMKSGDVIFKFITKYGIFSVLICIDCRELISKIGDVDYVIDPSYDHNPSRFHDFYNAEARDHEITIIQANAAEQSVEKEGKKFTEYGKSCIISKEYPQFINAFREEGYKQKEEDIPYKICEATGEMMIIADINIKIKSPPSPISTNYKGRIRGIRRYRWQKGEWQKY